MEWSDDADPDEEDIDDEGGKHHTGWMCDQENSCGDLSSRPLEANVIGWLPLPEPMGADDSVSWANT